jgi:plastocyanin
VEEKTLNTRQTLAKRFGFVTVAGALMLGSAVMISGPASAHEGTAHPAHIHTGQCPAPGDVVFPLNDLGGENATNGTPMATEPMGSTSAIPVDMSLTKVDSALNDLLDGNHAIVVHESKENIQNYIMCGDLGGTVMGGTDLAVGLGQLNDSGYSGVAWLHDNGDGTTNVTVFATESGGSDHHEEGTPSEDNGGYGSESSPSASNSSGNAVAVSIKDFAYGDPLEVSVGTTVTWTNEDSVPHTVTQDGGNGFQSGKIDPGGTFSYTFDTAGDFAYHCEYHANMKSSVTVK